MPHNTPSTQCPTCGKPVHYVPRARSPFFPFCSERCQLIDLGKWLCEEHRIQEPLSQDRQPCERSHKPEGRTDDSPGFSG